MTSDAALPDPVRLGAIGLGRAFALTAPAIAAHPGVRLVAAAAPRSESRAAFEAEFGGRAYDSVEALCADAEVEAVYISTPHGLHRDHVAAAAVAGKHVLVEKPAAIGLADASAMIEACEAAGVRLLVGPSHSFDAPVAKAREAIESGALGRVRMLHALNATDFLYRPRRAEELETAKGGGVVFSQAVHQVDIARLLCGGRAKTVTARTGAWDPARPTEGAYAALIDFEGGAFASLAYSGYGRFDADALMGGIDELGRAKPAGAYGAARRALRAAETDETAQKAARAFSTLAGAPQAETHEHFGPVTVFCERGDIRLHPWGIEVFADETREEIPCPFRTTRAEVFDALHAAIRRGAPIAQDGRWGRASLEICHAILKSADTGQPVPLHLQTGTAP